MLPAVQVAQSKEALGGARPVVLGLEATCVPTSELEIPKVGEGSLAAQKKQSTQELAQCPGKNLGAPSVPPQSPCAPQSSTGKESQALHKEVRGLEEEPQLGLPLQRSLGTQEG